MENVYHSIAEALPEIIIASIVAAVFFWVSKGRISDQTRKTGVGIYLAALVIVIIMLSQSGSAPKRLEVTETAPSYSQPLAELQDTSPEKMTPEESSKHLEKLREEQKQKTSLENEKSDDDQ